MSRKKAVWILFIIVTIMALSLSIIRYTQSSSIPLALQEKLEDNVLSYQSFDFNPPFSPTFVDRFFDYKYHRYKTTPVIELGQNPAKYCIRLQVVYRIPGNSRLSYRFKPPSEEFVYLAWQEDNEWHVQKIAQSGLMNAGDDLLGILQISGRGKSSLDHPPLIYPLTEQDEQRCILATKYPN